MLQEEGGGGRESKRVRERESERAGEGEREPMNERASDREETMIFRKL